MQEQIIQMTQSEYNDYTLQVALCGVVIGFLIALMAVAFITRNRE